MNNNQSECHEICKQYLLDDPVIYKIIVDEAKEILKNHPSKDARNLAKSVLGLLNEDKKNEL